MMWSARWWRLPRLLDINGQVINVGSGVETSIKDLISTVLTVTGSKANVVYNNQTSSHHITSKADLAVAKEKLRFVSSISLVEAKMHLDVIHRFPQSFYTFKHLNVRAFEPNDPPPQILQPPHL